jgi:hypothetical protein
VDEAVVLRRDAVIAAEKLRDYILGKYEILAPLKGPNGKTAWIRTIWIVLKGQQRARLVTVLPEARP